MEFAVRLDQPDVRQPGKSRRISFGSANLPAFAILNGRASAFEGGADEADLSLKWLAEGAAEYRTEGRAYRVANDEQLMLNRGQPYRMRMQGESFVLFFPKAAADAAWQMYTRNGEALPEIPTVAAASPVLLQNRLMELRDESVRARPSGEKLLELSCAVLGELVSLAHTRRRHAMKLPALRKTTRDELLRRVVRAESYLADLGTNATLAGAAHAAALSPFHLIRVFNAVFGQTPLAYAAAKRLERARDLLIESDKPIGDIALAAGYESRNAFDRAFLRRYRVTPGAFRTNGR
jgi:AraC family transcriptional regulator